MTRIQLQEIEFRQNIDLNGWTEVNRGICTSQLSNAFRLYHNVTFEYYTHTDREQFVKKWWATTMERESGYNTERIKSNIKDRIPLTKQTIHQQRALYSINWESAAWQIVNRVAYLFESKLRYID